MSKLQTLLETYRPTEERPLVVVTGAGLSVASGIPTFRGPDGYWTVGSEVYHPQDMATAAAFAEMPQEVWRWYLYRRAVCRAAEPNPAHQQLVAWEEQFGDGFAVITQNVDGLHYRAGSSRARTYEVHGSIDRMRDTVTGERLDIPEDIVIPDRDTALEDETFARLVNPATGHPTRPHVLWFDEVYDEENYRFYTAIGQATRAAICVVCGTSGAAAVPYHAVTAAVRNGAVLIDVSPDDNPFREIANEYGRGVALEATAVDGLAEIAAALP
ncbi:MAG: Sir2 family NAD-dependent protein deacetylase [Myxococcota bacterium]